MGSLCEVHKFDDPEADERYCVICGTPEFAIAALADCQNKLADLEKALNQDEHYCVFDDNGWSIEHLVSCRPSMTDCEFHKKMHETASLQGTRRGRFIMKLTASGLEFVEVIDD